MVDEVTQAVPEAGKPAKKPIFKKWWFWVIIAIIAIAVIGGSGSDGTVVPADGTSSSGEAVTSSDDEPEAPAAPEQDTKNLAVGDEVSRDGFTVGVLAVEDGPKDWGGDKTIKVTVHYKNESTEALSFNTYDWSVESASGVRSDAGITDAETIESGELAPGGELTGEVYLPAKDAAKIVFTSNMFWDSEEDLVMWIL